MIVSDELSVEQIAPTNLAFSCNPSDDGWPYSFSDDGVAVAKAVQKRCGMWMDCNVDENARKNSSDALENARYDSGCSRKGAPQTEEMRGPDPAGSSSIEVVVVGFPNGTSDAGITATTEDQADGRLSEDVAASSSCLRTG
jgi:hypothetical protein